MAISQYLMIPAASFACVFLVVEARDFEDKNRELAFSMGHKI